MSALTVTGPFPILSQRVRGSRGSNHGFPSLDEGSGPTRMKLSGIIPTPAVSPFRFAGFQTGIHIIGCTPFVSQQSLVDGRTADDPCFDKGQIVAKMGLSEQPDQRMAALRHSTGFFLVPAHNALAPVSPAKMRRCGMTDGG